MKYHIIFFTIIIFGIFISTAYVLNAMQADVGIDSQKLNAILNQISINSLNSQEESLLRAEAQKLINNTHLKVRTSIFVTVSTLVIMVSASILYLLSINRSFDKCRK